MADLRVLLGDILAAVEPHRERLKALLPAIEGKGFFERNAEAVELFNSVLGLLGLGLADPQRPTTPAYLSQGDVPGSRGGNVVLRAKQDKGARKTVSAKTTFPDRLVVVDKFPDRTRPAAGQTRSGGS